MRTIAVYLVSNGSYWRAEWRTVAGKKKARSIGNKRTVTQRDARAYCRRLGNQLSGERATSEAPRLSEWLEFYISSRTDVADKTLRSYRACRMYLSAYFDTNPSIDLITRAQAAEWMAAMASGEISASLEAGRNPGKKTNPYKKPGLFTIRGYVRVAKQMFEEAVSQDRIGSNPFRKLNGSVPRINKTWKEITTGDLGKILAECPSEPWRNLFRLAYWCGLRRSEATGLTWAAIDIARNRMTVHAGLEMETTKSRTRVVPIEPARCPSGMQAVLAAGGAADGPCAGINPNNLYRTALAIIRRAEVGEYAKPFHTLRKCCETRWASQYPQHVVSEWIGHDITVSAAHYLRVPEEMYACPHFGGKRAIGGR